jgi:hypothetical protein
VVDKNAVAHQAASMLRALLNHHVFRIIWVLLAIGFASKSSASLLLPQNLSSPDRKEALRLIGFGTAAKTLSDPYALGGYNGLEFGLSLETIPTEDLARLGNRLVAAQSDVTVPKFSVGKGLYSNLDFFIHFIPYNQRNELSQFGGILRWSFFEASSLPLSASVVAHINTGNISNQMATRTYGIDLMGGINVNEVALYAGVGAVQSVGSFVGGTSGVTDTQRLEYETVNTLHTFAGGTIRVGSVFVAIQLDRYTQSVLSGKLGLRF